MTTFLKSAFVSEFISCIIIVVMDHLLSELLAKNDEIVESRQLFDSYQTSENDFDKCFFNLFFLDYKFVFGDEPKNKFLFKLLKEYYHNDFFIRYSFINKVLGKSKAISFEEFSICNSRVDLASINGKSVAYEIKSEYDNYERLQKQIDDYSKCFEYVYVVCPKKRTKSIQRFLPDYCGIYSYNEKTNISFKIYKKASLSPLLSSSSMLSSLRKKDLLATFETDNIDDIVEKYSAEKINLIFKKLLKERFSNKWNLLKETAKSLD